MNSISSPNPEARPRGRVQFLLLATLFFFPLLASYILYFYFPEARPAGTTNYGELITPARPLPEARLSDAGGAALDTAALRGRWTFVVPAESCDETCEHRLVITRQVRLITNEKRSRVQRVLLLPRVEEVAATAQRLASEHPDLKVYADLGEPGQRLADVFARHPGAVYLIDPLGNWLMSYPAGRDPQADFKGLRKDLMKLLRLSQIG